MAESKAKVTARYQISVNEVGYVFKSFGKEGTEFTVPFSKIKNDAKLINALNDIMKINETTSYAKGDNIIKLLREDEFMVRIVAYEEKVDGKKDKEVGAIIHFIDKTYPEKEDGSYEPPAYKIKKQYMGDVIRCIDAAFEHTSENLTYLEAHNSSELSK